MAAPIERLPVEVFGIIAPHLDCPDYIALRLCSRQLRFLTFSTFAKRFLSTEHTTLGRPSLQRLVDRSCLGHMADVVTVLNIRLLCFHDYRILKDISRVGIFPPPKRFPKVPLVPFHHIDGESKLFDQVTKGEDLDCIVKPLTRVLRRFTSLKVIRFRTSRSENGQRNWEPLPADEHVFFTRCFKAIFDAITKSQVQLEEFRMARNRQKPTLVQCANKGCSSSRFSRPMLQSLQHCFQKLTSLTLSISPTHDGDDCQQMWRNSMVDFIAAAPSIQHLSLSLDHNARVSRIMPSLALTCQLPRLVSFHLANCSPKDNDLREFVLSHSDSLKQIVFSDVHLVEGNWSSIWLCLKTLTRLESLRLVFLAEQGSPVQFCRHDQGNNRKVTLRQPMSDLLDRLARAPRTNFEQFSLGTLTG